MSGLVRTGSRMPSRFRTNPPEGDEPADLAFGNHTGIPDTGKAMLTRKRQRLTMEPCQPAAWLQVGYSAGQPLLPRFGIGQIVAAT